MPGQFYRGDATVIKVEAINWVRNNEFGIPFSKADKIEGFLSLPESNYIENTSRKTFHNRWGFLNMIIFSLPEYAEKKIFNNDEGYALEIINKKSILLHNLLNLILSIFIVYYSYKISRLYTSKPFVSFVFVLLVIYTGYIWHYLRVQSYEIIHLVFFLGFYYYFIQFLRCLLLNKNSFNSKYFILFNTILVFLCLSKSFYFILYPLVVITCCWSLITEHSGDFSVLLKYKKILIMLCLPAIASLTVFLLCSSWYYDRYFIGHGSHDPLNLSNIWSIQYIPARLYDYLISQNYSLFVHIPILMLAIPSVHNFIYSYRYEAIFILLLFIFLISFFSVFYSVGEWCYGPRFFLFSAIILCLPAILSLETIMLKISQTKYLLLAIFISICSIYFINLQHNINQRPFFTRYHLEQFIAQAGIPISNDIKYYLETRNHAHISKNLNDFINTGKDNQLTYLLFRDADLENKIKLKTFFRKYFDEMLPANYF